MRGVLGRKLLVNGWKKSARLIGVDTSERASQVQAADRPAKVASCYSPDQALYLDCHGIPMTFGTWVAEGFPGLD